MSESRPGSRWPDALPARRVRIARPTDRLAAIRRFYGEFLELPSLGGFTDHDGYDGVMFGLPGADVHLEFTRHVDGSPAPDPDPDSILALFLPDGEAVRRIADRLAAAGHPPVSPRNPWWRDRAITVADPDGWRVALVDGTRL